MKTKLINFVKRNRWIYNIYYYVMNISIAILKIFVKPQDNLVLFISSGGKRYMDSPKDVYEQMLMDERFNDFDIVWAFRNPNEIEIPGRAKIIKTDSFEYFYNALKARCWITNVSVERGLNFKGKNTFYFCTWHGAPIKKIGYDIKNDNTFSTKGKVSFDMICAQGEYNKKVYCSAFGIEEEKILMSGFPRNDVLFEVDEHKYQEIRKKLGIPQNAKAILYAPTFHDTTTTGSVFAPPIHFDKWLKELGEEYYILFRAHPSIFELNGIKVESERILNVSMYPEINDLYVASDLLISDYSSIFFDYSILEKPMYCFAYDYSEYVKTRGLYFNICEEITGGEINEDELLDLIKNEDRVKEIKKVQDFNRKYLIEQGNATKQALDCIYENIKRG